MATPTPAAGPWGTATSQPTSRAPMVRKGLSLPLFPTCLSHRALSPPTTHTNYTSRRVRVGGVDVGTSRRPLRRRRKPHLPPYLGAPAAPAGPGPHQIPPRRHRLRRPRRATQRPVLPVARPPGGRRAGERRGQDWHRCRCCSVGAGDGGVAAGRRGGAGGRSESLRRRCPRTSLPHSSMSHCLSPPSLSLLPSLPSLC